MSAETVDQRLMRLRRMRALATGLLIVMAIVFVGASLAPRWEAMRYVQAFAEAAMVGACADWFAVTALFRRPLGLPIPHTAIIPRGKDRIGEALGRFIVENFLSPRVLDAKLRQFELAAWGGAWLQRPENARLIAKRMVVWGPELIRILPASAIESLAGSIALTAAKSVPAAPVASKLLTALWNDGRVQPLVERASELVAAYIADHQDVILETVQAQSWRWLPTWVDRAIAQKITRGVRQLLMDVREPDHPWRRQLASAIEMLIVQLAEDPELLHRGEVLKQRLLDDPRLAEHAHRLWSDIQRQLAGDWSDRSEALEDKIEQSLLTLGKWLCDEPTVQRVLNTSARALARSVLAPRRYEIGRFVAQVVAEWDTQSVVDRLELQIGPDLQYIRVSGTLVGGIVGLALFALTRVLGLA